MNRAECALDYSLPLLIPQTEDLPILIHPPHPYMQFCSCTNLLNDITTQLRALIINLYPEYLQRRHFKEFSSIL